MNFCRLAQASTGLLLGVVIFYSADIVGAQPAYRYNLIQKFIVANRFIFGADINKSFLYAYEPSSVPGVDSNTLCQNPAGAGNTPGELLILRPSGNSRWWAETPYEVIPCDGLDASPGFSIQDGDLLGVGRRFDGAQLHDLFVIDQPPNTAQR